MVHTVISLSVHTGAAKPDRKATEEISIGLMSGPNSQYFRLGFDP